MTVNLEYVEVSCSHDEFSLPILECWIIIISCNCNGLIVCLVRHMKVLSNQEFVQIQEFDFGDLD